MTPFERARAYLAKLDPAVSGQGGHNQTFTAACKLVEFGLSEEEAWELLWAFNLKCAPPWSERDLRHKLRDAFKRAEPGKKLREGYQSPAAPPPQWKPTAPAAPPAPPVKPARYDVLPAELPEPIEDGARMLLRHVFRPDDGVAIAKGDILDDADGKDRPVDGGLVLTAKDWLRRLDDALGKPTNIWTSSKGAGVFIRVNPMRLGGSLDADVTDFRHALLEWDNLSLEEQWALIHASRVPCAAVIYSGGKSIHAWVKIEAKDRAEYDERVRILHAHFAAYGNDPKNKNPSRFSRLPGALRSGRHQELLGINLGLSSWVEWQAELQAEGIGTQIKPEDLEAFDTSQDPNCLVGKRWLCKGGSLLIVGPSGVGKSSLTMQLAMTWALGRPLFGITPLRPLKFLVVQAENDTGDLAEEYQGVMAGMGIDPWDTDAETMARLRTNLVFVRDTTHTGHRFAEAIRILIERHHPDVVIFDPLLSFVGGDISKQEVCSEFLRGRLNPISEASGVAWIAIHHTGKPPADKHAKSAWQSSDWSYSGIGSSELVNWTRAAMVLRQTSPGAFQLMLTKRGNRSGATHPSGEPTSVVWLQHAQDGRIHWEHVQPPEEPAAEASGSHQDAPEGTGRGGGGGKKGRGRRSRVDHAIATFPIEDWVTSIPADGWGRNEAARSLENWLATKGEDIPLDTIKASEGGMLSKLVARGKLAKRDGKYMRP